MKVSPLGFPWPTSDPFLTCVHRPFGNVSAARSRGTEPLELFQIWLNLPARDKLADPYFTMLWDKDIPRYRPTDANARGIEVTVIAGQIAGVQSPSPPPYSWAASAEAEVAIWSVALESGAAWTMPAARDPRTIRTHPRQRGRFAQHADGRVEEAPV